MIPLVLDANPGNTPGAVGIYQFMSANGVVQYGPLAAYAILFSAPVVLLYLICSRWLNGGFAFAGGRKRMNPRTGGDGLSGEERRSFDYSGSAYGQHCSRGPDEALQRQDSAAVYDLDLEVEDGEFLVVVGPSGCGKTTTLRMLAGFETPTARSDTHRRQDDERGHAEGQEPGHGLPELCPLPAHDGRKKPGFRHENATHAQDHHGP